MVVSDDGRVTSGNQRIIVSNGDRVRVIHVDYTANQKVLNPEDSLQMADQGIGLGSGLGFYRKTFLYSTSCRCLVANGCFVINPIVQMNTRSSS